MANAAVLTKVSAASVIAHAVVVTAAVASSVVGSHAVVVTSAQAAAVVPNHAVVVTKAEASAGFVVNRVVISSARASTAATTNPVVISKASASAVVVNLPPALTLDRSSCDPGEQVAVTVSDSDGTIVSVVVTGFSPAPTVLGSGSSRSFTAPPVAADTVLTVTATDDDAATTSATVTVRKSGLMVCPQGTWVPAYVVTGG